MEKYLNVGCGPFRTNLANWINTDVIHIPGHTEPDLVVTPEDPLPFEDASFTRIYMGHVLEHVPYEKVDAFLRLVKSKLVDGGWIMVVGPDVKKCMALWKQNKVTDERVFGGLEDDMWDTPENVDKWFGARHQWNAYGERVKRLVDAAGFSEVTVLDITNQSLFTGWPVVSFSEDQMALIGRKFDEQA